MEKSTSSNTDDPTEMQQPDIPKVSSADGTVEPRKPMALPPREAMPPPPPRFDAAKASSENDGGFRMPEAPSASSSGKQGTMKSNGQPFRAPPPKFQSRGAAHGSTVEPSNGQVADDRPAIKPRSSEGALARGSFSSAESQCRQKP